MKRAYKIIALFLVIFLIGVLSFVMYINKAYDKSEVKSVETNEQHTESKGSVYYSFN